MYIASILYTYMIYIYVTIYCHYLFFNIVILVSFRYFRVSESHQNCNIKISDGFLQIY